MIVADTSALAAILFDEKDAAVYADRLETEPDIAIGAPTLLELRLLMLHRKGPDFLVQIDRLVEGLAMRVVAFGPDHLTVATAAARRFRGRPAKLNFGDCMTYAIAVLLDAPLLFKGDDFGHTDVRAALRA